MKKRTIILTMLLFVAVISTKAQEAVATTGGDASGSGGSASYTVGQTVYTTNADANGNSMAQGVQQPYEISTTIGIKETTIQLELAVYPNPTTNSLNLKTEEHSNMSYQLYDMQGKLIATNKVTNNTTKISLLELPSASYFLKVKKGNKLVKVFKIIKNK